MRLFPVHKSTCLRNWARARYIPLKKKQELWPSLRYLFPVATRTAVFPAAPKSNVRQENMRTHPRAEPLRWSPFTPHMPPGSVPCKVASECSRTMFSVHSYQGEHGSHLRSHRRGPGLPPPPQPTAQRGLRGGHGPPLGNS